MSEQTKDDCIYDIYQDLLKYSNEKIANLICYNIERNIIINFLIIQIKGKNTTLLQLLWFVFKKYDYMRDLINNSMLHLILTSFDNSHTFFELFKWYEEFGYKETNVSSNITLALYIQANKYPEIKKYLFQIINRINNKNNVHNSVLFFIHDDVDVIKPYFTKDPELTLRMINVSYQYDAINTLKQIQYKNKIKFFTMHWYLLSPHVFNQHMIDNKRNPFENDEFSLNWINFICSTYHWDYLPIIINKMTPAMWKKLIEYFYMGYLTQMFVMVLFQQMKLNNIPYEKLKSNKLKFIPSDNLPFLIENNLIHIFENSKGYIVSHSKLDDNMLEVTQISIPSLLIIFGEKRINELTEIIFEFTLNMSNRYNSEINYIDKLLLDDQLGWDAKTIKTYENFKMIMARIIDEANLAQDLVNKYNSFLPLTYNRLPYPYQLRYINHFINSYNKFTIKLFKDQLKTFCDSWIRAKQDIIKEIRKETNSELDHKIFYVLPENPTIYDEFKNVIENSDCYDSSKEHYNNYWINELNDNKLIKNIVRNMLVRYHVVIQEIIPILYRHYSYYATEEHLFLE